jgi:hypothetical protein
MKQEVAELHAARRMITPLEVKMFESALARLATGLSLVDIVDLHLALDDNTQHQEVMFGLVHFLESLPVETQLRALVKVLPQLAIQSPRWAKILHYRILNHGPSKVAYQEILSRDGSGEAKVSAESVLSVIVGEKPSAATIQAQALLHALRQ